MSLKDKGKARAIDSPIQSVDRPSIPPVKPQPIPATPLLNIEYPGILSDEPGASSLTSYSSLERALCTLHPSSLPPFTSCPHEALCFLSRIPNEGLNTIECRLGAFGSPLPPTAKVDNKFDQLFKTPLMGQVVPTYNVVIRIVKRTWRQKKRKRSSSASASPQVDNIAQSNDMTLDPALFVQADTLTTDGQSLQSENQKQASAKRSRYTGRVKKEYCIEVLGLATKTVRFRSMADFAFRPDVYASATTDVATSPPQLDAVMELHKALATMDLGAFQCFRVPEHRQEYQVPNDRQPSSAQPKSNLHMLPPAFFSRIDVPFNYNFQQTTYSELRTVHTPAHLTSCAPSFAHALRRTDLPAGQMQRFVNRVRLPNITPQQFRVGRDSTVPCKPLADVVRIEHRCDRAILARLRQLLQERPVWSRVALKNQLSAVELRELDGSSEKVYYALVGYAMVGGPWRDTIVRFGYDVSLDNSSRIYQRVFLRGGPMRRESRLAQQSLADKSTAHHDDEAMITSRDARPAVVPLPSDTRARANNTHLFDGTTLHRNIGNFQLCDIHDGLIEPYIWQDMDNHHVHTTDNEKRIVWLRETMDVETGWYTRRALDLIRALVAARFKALAESGKPLEHDAVHTLVARIRHKWSEEDTGSVLNPQHVPEQQPQTPNIQPIQPDCANPPNAQHDPSNIDPALI